MPEVGSSPGASWRVITTSRAAPAAVGTRHRDRQSAPEAGSPRPRSALPARGRHFAPEVGSSPGPSWRVVTTSHAAPPQSALDTEIGSPRPKSAVRARGRHLPPEIGTSPGPRSRVVTTSSALPRDANSAPTERRDAEAVSDGVRGCWGTGPGVRGYRGTGVRRYWGAGLLGCAGTEYWGAGQSSRAVRVRAATRVASRRASASAYAPSARWMPITARVSPSDRSSCTHGRP